MSIKFTRKQYLDKECTHRQYYAQFVTDQAKGFVRLCITMDALLKSEDEDGCFNDIPLRKWDLYADPCPAYLGDLLRAAGDYPTLSGMVCIAKEAARQLLEETRAGL